MRKSRLKKTVAGIMAIALILTGMPQMYKEVNAHTKENILDDPVLIHHILIF